VFGSLATGSPRSLFGCFDNGLDFHLAAITGAASTHDRREERFAVNYEGTENVLTAAGKLGVDHVVFASSCNIYGRATSTDIDETVESDPINHYAETKRDAEGLLRVYCEEYDMTGTALRIATNYGDGSNWRSFVHVADAARAYGHAVHKPDAWTEPVYNVGSNDANYRIEEIAEVVREEVEDVDVTYLEDEHPGPSYHVNFDRLAETGFETERSLRDGIRSLKQRFMDK
jgi:nucleoside-diphosphate-sugar epimerase